MSNSSDKILWKSTFETGIEEMDDQHRRLVNTINKANYLLINEYTIENLQDITKDLLDYTLYHFQTEETLMYTYQYDTHTPDDYALHMQEHREFTSKVKDIHTTIQNGEMIGREEIINYLCEWLIDHINSTDKKLGSFLTQIDD